MPQRPYILAESSWKDLRQTPPPLAVLPWGATEAHNTHLPYGTDVLQCDAIAAESARLAHAAGTPVMVLPTVPFGVQTGQLDIPYCLNMNPSTQAALLRDLTQGLDQQGVRMLVILNGHGGNEFKAIIRELQPQVRVFLCVLDWFRALDPRAYFDEPGDHAGELETSLMMHLAADLVRPLSDAGVGRENRRRVVAFREGWAWAPRRWTQASADTGVGNPAAASAAKGRRYFEALAAKIAGFLTDLHTHGDAYGDPPSGSPGHG